MPKKKPYIFIDDKTFTVSANGYEIYLALKILFEQLKKTNPDYHRMVVGALENSGVLQYK